MSNLSKLSIVAALALLILASFGLGWLLRGEIKQTPIIIEKHS